jgi:hypothetical protein
MLGTASFRSSSRFPPSSGAMKVNPVMFPPGRARLATSPLPTGSAIGLKTMGIVLVARFAARAEGVASAKSRSTRRRTRSEARFERVDCRPSANRHSIEMVCPST